VAVSRTFNSSPLPVNNCNEQSRLYAVFIVTLLSLWQQCYECSLKYFTYVCSRRCINVYTTFMQNTFSRYDWTTFLQRSCKHSLKDAKEDNHDTPPLAADIAVLLLQHLLAINKHLFASPLFKSANYIICN
jgi:hypothetical protein